MYKKYWLGKDTLKEENGQFLSHRVVCFSPAQQSAPVSQGGRDDSGSLHSAPAPGNNMQWKFELLSHHFKTNEGTKVKKTNQIQPQTKTLVLFFHYNFFLPGPWELCYSTPEKKNQGVHSTQWNFWWTPKTLISRAPPLLGDEDLFVMLVSSRAPPLLRCEDLCLMLVSSRAPPLLGDEDLFFMLVSSRAPPLLRCEDLFLCLWAPEHHPLLGDEDLFFMLVSSRAPPLLRCEDLFLCLWAPEHHPCFDVRTFFFPACQHPQSRNGSQGPAFPLYFPL